MSAVTPAGTPDNDNSSIARGRQCSLDQKQGPIDIKIQNPASRKEVTFNVPLQSVKRLFDEYFCFDTKGISIEEGSAALRKCLNSYNSFAQESLAREGFLFTTIFDPEEKIECAGKKLTAANLFLWSIQNFSGLKLDKVEKEQLILHIKGNEVSHHLRNSVRHPNMKDDDLRRLLEAHYLFITRLLIAKSETNAPEQHELLDNLIRMFITSLEETKKNYDKQSAYNYTEQRLLEIAQVFPKIDITSLVNKDDWENYWTIDNREFLEQLEQMIPPPTQANVSAKVVFEARSSTKKAAKLNEYCLALNPEGENCLSAWNEPLDFIANSAKDKRVILVNSLYPHEISFDSSSKLPEYSLAQLGLIKKLGETGYKEIAWDENVYINALLEWYNSLDITNQDTPENFISKLQEYFNLNKQQRNLPLEEYIFGKYFPNKPIHIAKILDFLKRLLTLADENSLHVTFFLKNKDSNGKLFEDWLKEREKVVVFNSSKEETFKCLNFTGLPKTIEPAKVLKIRHSSGYPVDTAETFSLELSDYLVQAVLSKEHGWGECTPDSKQGSAPSVCIPIRGNKKPEHFIKGHLKKKRELLIIIVAGYGWFKNIMPEIPELKNTMPEIPELIDLTLITKGPGDKENKEPIIPAETNTLVPLGAV